MSNDTLIFRLTQEELDLFSDWRKKHYCIYLVKNLKVLLTEEEKKKYDLERCDDGRSLYIEGGEFQYVFSIMGTRGVLCPCGASYFLPSRREMAEGKGMPLCGCSNL